MVSLRIRQKDAQGSVSPLWVRIKRVWARYARLAIVFGGSLIRLTSARKGLHLGIMWLHWAVAWLHRAMAWLHRGIWLHREVAQLHHAVAWLHRAVAWLRRGIVMSCHDMTRVYDRHDIRMHMI